MYADSLRRARRLCLSKEIHPLTYRQCFQLGDHRVRHDPGLRRCISYEELHVIAFVFCLHYLHIDIRAVQLLRHRLFQKQIRISPSSPAIEFIPLSLSLAPARPLRVRGMSSR
jgi:hypothetical protein